MLQTGRTESPFSNDGRTPSALARLVWERYQASVDAAYARIAAANGTHIVRHE